MNEDYPHLLNLVSGNRICALFCLTTVCLCSCLVLLWHSRHRLIHLLCVVCFDQNKKERKKVREVGILKKDPDQIRDQIQKLEMMSK